MVYYIRAIGRTNVTVPMCPKPRALTMEPDTRPAARDSAGKMRERRRGPTTAAALLLLALLFVCQVDASGSTFRNQNSRKRNRNRLAEKRAGLCLVHMSIKKNASVRRRGVTLYDENLNFGALLRPKAAAAESPEL
ncbi:unnamed protein product [Plutella xylostella]|uniref:(diamondback moth) hypothetical protein n=1 Tax=Plutella xylostella TaxID=51655 RepID=A0A8S4D053_PLUXY|nr:unnamed protein product [Plutella xylostella]